MGQSVVSVRWGRDITIYTAFRRSSLPWFVIRDSRIQVGALDSMGGNSSVTGDVYRERGVIRLSRSSEFFDKFGLWFYIVDIDMFSGGSLSL